MKDLAIDCYYKGLGYAGYVHQSQVRGLPTMNEREYINVTAHLER